MSVAGNGTPLGAPLEYRAPDCLIVQGDTGFDPLRNGREELASRLGGAQHHRAAAEDPCGDRALQRFRRRRECHACDYGARYQAVLGDGHQRCIEYPPLAGGGQRRR
jgi:hypothetical protein